MFHARFFKALMALGSALSSSLSAEDSSYGNAGGIFAGSASGLWGTAAAAAAASAASLTAFLFATLSSLDGRARNCWPTSQSTSSASGGSGLRRALGDAEAL